MSSIARLLLISERFAPDVGGVARSATRTASALAALGVETEVLAWTRALPGGMLESREFPAAAPGAARMIVHRLGMFANLDYSLQHSLTLLHSLHERRPFDAVWGHYLAPAGFLAVLFGESIGVATTVSARGNDVDMLVFPPGDFARLTWVLERARVVTAVSRDLARKIQVIAPHRRPAIVVPNSVDARLFRPAEPDPQLRDSLGILPEEFVLGFSGELRHKKGLAPLLAAFCQARARRPTCLLVIGEVRVRDQAALASFAAEQPAARARLLVTGHLEQPSEVARHLRLCDVFLQPSIWDGMPNAVLEAMACERIVLASDAGGIPEVVEHGESGFLVPRTQLDRLGEAILEVAAMPVDRRRAMEQSARRRVEGQFSPAREAESLRQVLAALASTEIHSGHG